MIISIIVAVSENNVIGKNNTLIWHLPTDMKFFMTKTTGHCVITGRKNYDSIPVKFSPLPNRTNIVVTHQKDYSAPGAIVVGSIEDAITFAKTIEREEIFVIGGAQIYKKSLHLCNKIYLTRIHHTFDGDAFFPVLNMNEWKETERVKGIVDDKNIYAHDFITYERIT